MELSHKLRLLEGIFLKCSSSLREDPSIEKRMSPFSGRPSHRLPCMSAINVFVNFTSSARELLRSGNTCSNSYLAETIDVQLSLSSIACLEVNQRFPFSSPKIFN